MPADSLDGRWDGVGPIYEIAPGLTLFLDSADDGTFSGFWSQGEGSNVVSNGTFSEGVVRFTLVGFLGGSRDFEGGLTNRYRIAGALQVPNLDGDAVFRRSSFEVVE